MQERSPDSPVVLVVAPKFPSIEQPWLDTYLEHLALNKLEFWVATKNPNTDRASAKALKYDMLVRTRLYNTGLGSMVKALSGFAIKHPLESLRTAANAFKASRHFADNGQSRLRSMVKLCYFGAFARQLPRPDVIHCHGEIAAWEFLHYSLLLDIPLMMTFHGLPPAGVPQLGKAKRQMLYQQVRRVLVNTGFALEQVVSLSCDRNRLFTLPQGLPIEEFPYHPQAPIADAPLRLLTVARISREKGHVYVVLAIERLRRIGIDVHYTVVGAGNARERVERLVRRLGLADRVTVHEGVFSEKLRPYYEDAQVFVLASTAQKATLTETQGVVLQEAQASGCIVVTTAVGGIPEVVDDGVNAFVVKDRSSRELARVLQQLAEHPEHWEQWQQAGREHVEQHFEAGHIGRRMLAHLQDVAAGA